VLKAREHPTTGTDESLNNEKANDTLERDASSDTDESSSADSSSESANNDTDAPTTSSAIHELRVEDFAKMDDEIEEALGACVIVT
jgi:pullulanase/glycogen debranching enzyme